jgi:hypothetical protein
LPPRKRPVCAQEGGSFAALIFAPRKGLQTLAPLLAAQSLQVAAPVAWNLPAAAQEDAWARAAVFGGQQQQQKQQKQQQKQQQQQQQQ